MQTNKCDSIGCSSCGSGETKEPGWKKEKALHLGAALVLLLIGLYLEFLQSQELPAHAAYLVVAVLAGHEIILRALKSVAQRRLDMNVLMTIAATGAFLIGHAEEGASVLFLFAIAEFLEEYAAEKSRNSIGQLLKLTPQTARLRKIGKVIRIDVHQLKVGDVVVVKPGDQVPIDGVVVLGESFVNQAPITGESTPVKKKRQDAVYAGTLNKEGYLEIRVTKNSEKTLLSRIQETVENAQKNKSNTEKFVDKFATYYTPAVIALAALVAIVPPLLLDEAFDPWIYRSLVLLVAACPCALAISTPVSLVSSLTSAARNGVLIKGGAYVEQASKTKAIVLDKTGTLTRGVFEVDQIVPLNGYTKEELLKIAASIEAHSTHPIAEAIVKIGPRRVHAAKNFHSMTGKGLRGTIQGTEYFIGSLRLPVPVSEKARKTLQELEAQGKTVVLIGTKKEAMGILSISDKIREEAPKAIQDLKSLGVTPVMITGDNQQTAKAIASQLGIEHYHAGLLPEEKLKEIEKLKAQHGSVMMVGDGVNDAPALATADVGVAMGAIGTDTAIETADIAIMRDDLSRLPYLIKLSRKTMTIVKENIAASILVKGGTGLLAIPGFISLWIAVAVGDMGLSLAVILNALRIGNSKLRTRF